MDHRVAPLLQGALAALAVVALVSWLAGRARRWRAQARLRRGHRGERDARRILEQAGWRVVQGHPAGELALDVGGDQVTQPLCADYLCEKGGRRLPAEVKTGDAADPRGRATRRQLLEYAVAYGAGSTLFVDADQGTVVEVVFPGLRETRARTPWGTLLVVLAVGVGVGLWLGGRPFWP